jgi:type II secretory pathway predicted ATPase ExeA
MMAECIGTVSVGTQTDREMARYVRDEANDLGISQAEFLRRLLEHYRDSRKGELACPECDEQLRVSL